MSVHPLRKWAHQIFSAVRWNLSRFFGTNEMWICFFSRNPNKCLVIVNCNGIEVFFPKCPNRVVDSTFFSSLWLLRDLLYSYEKWKIARFSEIPNKRIQISISKTIRQLCSCSTLENSPNFRSFKQMPSANHNNKENIIRFESEANGVIYPGHGAHTASNQ